MSTLEPLPFNKFGTDLDIALEDEARRYIATSRSASTLRAYASDWRAFLSWCDRHHRTPLPADPATVALFIADMARTSKASTIQRRLSALSVAHQSAGMPSPTGDIVVRSTWAGIRRTIGVAQVGKEALLTENVRAIVEVLPDTLIGNRDRCLLLLGFASALRRSELVALDLADIADTHDGLVITVRRSKSDQAAEGRQIGVPFGANPNTCPVRAYRRWVNAAALESGPVFRSVRRHGVLGTERLSDRAVALIVKRRAEAIGLPSDGFAGHSLRSGMATSAARAGATEVQIMAQTGHKSLPTLRRYIRRGSLFSDNAAGRLGL